MGLLDTEILSNRFDVENSLNNAMTERAQGYGALDRSVYAPMTASTALQGDMAGQAIGGMLGGQQVEMQKQDIIDDIMKRNPDPKTSDELRSVAGEFAKAGLTDYSFQITEVANQLYKTEVDKNVATDKWYTGTGKSLKNSLLTDDILKAYIYQKENITAKDWNDDDQWTRMDRKDALASARTDLGGQIDNYSNRLMQDGYSKSMLKDLQKNDADFMQHFLTDLSQYGNQDIKDFFQSVMVFDSKAGKNSISISSEYVARLSQDEIDVMDFQSAALLYDNLKDTEKLTKTQREVFKKLETKIKSPNGFEVNEVELREILTTEGNFDAEKIEEIIEQHMQRTNQTYKGVGTSASIAPVDDGTMMAMNTQQPNNNFSDWIVTS